MEQPDTQAAPDCESESELGQLRNRMGFYLLQGCLSLHSPVGISPGCPVPTGVDDFPVAARDFYPRSNFHPASVE